MREIVSADSISVESSVRECEIALNDAPRNGGVKVVEPPLERHTNEEPYAPLCASLAFRRAGPAPGAVFDHPYLHARRRWWLGLRGAGPAKSSAVHRPPEPRDGRR